jgi:hypothetical protein
MRLRSALLLAVALPFAACATYREDLNRGQNLYDQNDHERALAIWRVLERDMDSLQLTDQARYAYLRGMTDLALGFRADARHWLAIAKAIEKEHAGGLSDAWKQRMEQELDKLNQEVYGGAERRDSASTAVEHTRVVDDQGGGAVPGPGAAAPGCTPPCPSDQICQAGECVPP